GPRADQPRDLLADARRQIDPPRAIPARDEPLAPLALGHLGQPSRRGPRQGTERVAVEVDDPRGQREQLATRGERIDGGEPGPPGAWRRHGEGFRSVPRRRAHLGHIVTAVARTIKRSRVQRARIARARSAASPPGAEARRVVFAAAIETEPPVAWSNALAADGADDVLDLAGDASLAPRRPVGLATRRNRRGPDQT